MAGHSRVKLLLGFVFFVRNFWLMKLWVLNLSSFAGKTLRLRLCPQQILLKPLIFFLNWIWEWEFLVLFIFHVSWNAITLQEQWRRNCVGSWSILRLLGVACDRCTWLLQMLLLIVSLKPSSIDLVHAHSTVLLVLHSTSQLLRNTLEVVMLQALARGKSGFRIVSQHFLQEI